MARNVRVNTVMDQDLVARVDRFAADRLEDRSTAIRQLVAFALREHVRRDTIVAYVSGRITLRELARILGLDTWSAQDLLAAEGIAIAQGDREETKADLDALAGRSSGRGRSSRARR